MKFSTRTRYGIRAMVEIAKNTSDEAVFQKDIAEAQDISNKYLDHIIHALKVAGLIANQRGRKSGYVLTKDASEITIFDIHSAFEPGICVIDCLSKTYNCPREKGCEAKGFWGGLNQRITDYFKSISLKDLVENEGILEDAVI